MSDKEVNPAAKISTYSGPGAIGQNGDALKYVPEHLKVEALCTKAVNKREPGVLRKLLGAIQSLLLGDESLEVRNKFHDGCEKLSIVEGKTVVEDKTPTPK